MRTLITFQKNEVKQNQNNYGLYEALIQQTKRQVFTFFCHRRLLPKLIVERQTKKSLDFLLITFLLSMFYFAFKVQPTKFFTAFYCTVKNADFAGEEVSDNYGPVYYFKPRAERQAELSARYWFHCACPACQGDWPLLGTKLS